MKASIVVPVDPCRIRCALLDWRDRAQLDQCDSVN